MHAYGREYACVYESVRVCVFIKECTRAKARARNRQRECVVCSFVCVLCMCGVSSVPII